MVDCGGGGNKGDRFVCPSDRQLALRAKLKTGWSIKTGSLGQPYPPVTEPLSTSETDVILSVVRRAEAEEKKEAERVGKLVDRLENMKRMALGKSPTECLLCGETFGMLSGGPRMICVDCKRMVCNKCGVESSSSKLHRDIWLCKICSETREMWKKSGAWFFRGLPRYVLPPTSKLRLPGSSNSSCYLQQHNSSKSPTGKHEDTGGGGGGASSGSEDDQRRSSSICRANQRKDVSVTPDADVHCRRGSLSDARTASPSVTFQDARGHSRWDDHASMTTSESFYSRSVDSHPSGRRDSIASRSDITFSLDDNASVSGAGSVGASNSYQGIAETQILTCPLDASLGTIELTLHYDSYSNVLHCTVHRAKNLTPMDINNLSDPFCKLNILPTNNPSTRLRTKTVHKTRNPEFNETLTFYGVTDNDILKKALHILILDDDKYGYDFMGESKIALIGLRAQNSLKLIATLCGSPSLTDVAPDSEHLSPLWGDVPNTRGQILIGLTYNTKRRALIVGIMRCVHLPPMDSNGFSDPFVKLLLSPDTHHKKHKTSIKWKTLNPIFNEEFAFETRPTELSSQSLRLTVWDKDYGKSNDYLGGLILGSMSKGKRLKHWLDVIKFPDHRHEAWHSLTEDMVTD